MAESVEYVNKGIFSLLPDLVNNRIAWMLALHEIENLKSQEYSTNNMEILRIIDCLLLTSVPSKLLPGYWSINYQTEWVEFYDLLHKLPPVICIRCDHEMYWKEIDKSYGFVCSSPTYCQESKGLLKMYRDSFW